MKKPRILAIDDESEFTDFLKQYFELRGYTIDVVSDGVKGVELLRQGKYDAVLLDLKMLGFDGDEVMREVKRFDVNVKIIFISAYDDMGKTKTRLLAEGAYAFIEKPIKSLKDLEKLVTSAVTHDRRRSGAVRMLVVDDEPDICDFVKNFFEERKFEVFTAFNGREGLGLVRSKRPEIILLDMKMPIMDGMDVLREIRKIENESRIIVVTAVDNMEKCEAAKRYGVMEYITKPLLLEHLEKTIFAVADDIKTKALI